MPASPDKNSRPMGILILGEHDKGLGEPFSPKTVSGRRLRGMLSDLGINATLGNVFEYAPDTLRERDLPAATSGYGAVVALGRVAAAECSRQGVQCVRLPHPAVRSMTLLQKLRAGLADVAGGAPVASQNVP